MYEIVHEIILPIAALWFSMNEGKYTLTFRCVLLRKLLSFRILFRIAHQTLTELTESHSSCSFQFSFVSKITK